MTTRRKPVHPVATPRDPFLLYTTEDSRTSLEVHLENETVWLSLKHLGHLGKKDFHQIQPGPVLGCEHELESCGSEIGARVDPARPTGGGRGLRMLL